MPANRIWIAQRAIVLQLLRNDDHPVLWTRPELEAELRDEDTEPQAVVDALAILGIEGVAAYDDRWIWASRCARHLDWLELIGV